MKKTFSKIVSMVLTVCFLLSIIPMTPVFAAPGGYNAPIVNESFESLNVGTKFIEGDTVSDTANLPGDWNFYSYTSSAVCNTTVSVKADDETSGKVISFEKSAVATGTPDRRFIQKAFSFDSDTTLATVSFRTRRMNATTKSMMVYFANNKRASEGLRFEFSTGKIFKGSEALDTAFTDINSAFNSSATPFIGFWHQIEFVLDYTAKTVSLYVNGVKLPSYTGSTNPYSIPFSTLSIPDEPEDFIGLEFGVNNAAQTNTASPSEVQLDDICVREYNDTQALSAAANRIGHLDGAKIADSISLPNDVGFGTTVEWSSSDTQMIAIDGTLSNRPVVGEDETNVTLTAKITRGRSTIDKICTVSILPENIKLYEDFESYLGASGRKVGNTHNWNNWSSLASNNEAERNSTMSIKSLDSGVTSNNAANLLRSVTGTTAPYAHSSLNVGLGFDKELPTATTSTKDAKLSFKLMRGNSHTKQINVTLRESSNDDLLGIAFDLTTGAVTSPALGSSSSPVVRMPAYPAGSTLYIADYQNTAVPAGKWLDVEIYFLYEDGHTDVMIYVNGKPCVYGPNAENGNVSVSAGQAMLPHTIVANDGEGVDHWVNRITRLFFAADNSNDTTDGLPATKRSSFFIDDIVVETLLENAGTEITAANESSVTINSIRTLPSNAKVLAGVYNDSTKLFEGFRVLTPQKVNGIENITIASPFVAGEGKNIKAFIWDMNTLTPLGAMFE